MTTSSLRLFTADNPATAECVAVPGAEHDYRAREWDHGSLHAISWVCVWCGVLRCGDADETDPCIEPYLHVTDHRDARGDTWPKWSIRRRRAHAG